MYNWWSIEKRNSCSKTPNLETLYGKVDTKLTFQERLVIGLAE